jgi:hypothetical protein
MIMWSLKNLKSISRKFYGLRDKKTQGTTENSEGVDYGCSKPIKRS